MSKRKDGILVKNLDGMHNLMPYIMSKRCDSDVYIHKTIDVTDLVEYVKKVKDSGHKDITFFHVFSTATGMLLYHRPLLNRFISNKKFYDRKDITLSFVAKKEFTDKSEEVFSVIKVEKDDNLFSISEKIATQVKNIRTNKTNNADAFIDLVGKMPKLIKSLAVKLLIFADNHDLIPEDLTKNSIYHSSVLMSNLGSINCDAIYHHLIDFGTNSVLMTIGKIEDAPMVIDGKVTIRKVCDFGVNIDERIADGFYFAKSLQLFEHILTNPSLMENTISTSIEIQKK